MQPIDRSRPPKIETSFEITPGSVEQITLPNGVTLCLCGDPVAQDVVRLDVMTRGGRWHQQCPLQATYTNRMLQEGTRHHTSLEIAEMFDSHGAWTDFSSSLLYSYASLYTLKKYFRPMAELLHEVVAEPAFDEDELKIQTSIGKQNQKVNFSRPAFHSRNMLARMLFGDDHPASACATLDDYDNLTSGLLRSFYTQHYNTANTTILMSGNFSDDLIATVSDLFGREVTAGSPTPVQGLHRDVVTTDEGIRVKSMPEASQTSLRMGLFVPDRSNADYPDLHILTTVFGGYFGSRLMQNIREEKGYTYGISASLVAYPGTTVMSIASEVNSNHVEETIAEIKREMDRLRDELVSDDELEMVRNYLSGELMRSFDEPFYAADTKMFLLEFGLGQDYYARVTDALRSVTAESLREVARRYYDPQSLKVAVAGNV